MTVIVGWDSSTCVMNRRREELFRYQGNQMIFSPSSSFPVSCCLLTLDLCDVITSRRRVLSLIFSSRTQNEMANSLGRDQQWEQVSARVGVWMCQKIFHLHNELIISNSSISRSTRHRAIDSIGTNSISENENERDFRIAFFDMIDRRVTPVHTIDRRRCVFLCVSLPLARARQFYWFPRHCCC